MGGVTSTLAPGSSAQRTVPFSEAEALAWLQAAGTCETSCTALARHWRWTSSRVKRQLIRWSELGRIKRQVAQNRTGTKLVWLGADQSVGSALVRTSEPIRAVPVPVLDRTSPIQRVEPVPSTSHSMKRTSPARSNPAAPIRRTGAARNDPITPIRETGPVDGVLDRAKLYRWFRSATPPAVPPVRTIGNRLLAFGVGLALAGLGLAMGYVSMRINQWSGAALASTPEAAHLWETGSALADGFKMVLLTGAGILWSEGLKGWARLLVAAWLVTLAYSIMAASGFAALNIADSTTKRGSVAAERQQLTADVARHRQALGWDAVIEERSRRSAASIAVALQEAQPKVARSAWKATNGCADVTIEGSRAACGEVLALRAELDEAGRRETAAAELKQLEDRLNKLPPVAAADPQAQMLAKTVSWLSFGAAGFAEQDVGLLRFLLIVLMIELPGALGLSAGIEIWRRAVFA
jgi:hypothetical protein